MSDAQMRYSGKPGVAVRDSFPVAALVHLANSDPVPPVVIDANRGDMIYNTHNSNQWVYCIERGFVKIVATSREGKSCLLGIYTRGDLIGDLFFGGPSMYEFAVAMTRTRLYRFGVSQLHANLEDEDWRADFIRYLSRRIISQRKMIIDFVTADCEYRFGAILLDLANTIAAHSGDFSYLRLRITQEEFASMVGTTRSRIGLFLRNFIDNGAVIRERGGALRIHRESLMRYLAHNV
ncbi:Crp/Fnr family transcriptional regulator [Mycobacterium stomatepiae]|nr:Crp/Fnr family transcriptional regulator [Mycobacterium stomatepiae]